MKKLSVSFLNDEGKAHTWSMKNPNQEMTGEYVKEKMEALTELELFQRDGIQLFSEVKSAKYVEVIETELF